MQERIAVKMEVVADQLVVLCNDGSMWVVEIIEPTEETATTARWHSLAFVPQPGDGI